MARPRTALAIVLSIVLGVLVGLGAGALLWGGRPHSRAVAASTPTTTVTTEPAIVRSGRHVDAGAYLWRIDAKASAAIYKGTDVKLALFGARDHVVGYSTALGAGAVSIPLDRFFAPDGYDSSPLDTKVAVLRRDGARDPFAATLVGSDLERNELILTLRTGSVDLAALAASDDSSPTPLTILIDGAPVGPRT